MSLVKLASTDQFINLWQEEECLWNISSTNYKNRDQRRKSVKRLMEKCDMSEAEVKRKMNTLRSYYSKELAKCAKKSDAGRDKTYESKWHFFQAMSFLKDVIAPRKTISSYDVDELGTEEENDFQYKDYGKEVKLEENNLENNQESPDLPRSTNKLLPKKRKATKQQTEEDIALSEGMDILAAKKREPRDSDIVFGENIGVSLQSIGNKRCKELAKVKIQEIIFQAQFGLLSMPALVANTPTSLQYFTSPPSPVVNTPRSDQGTLHNRQWNSEKSLNSY